MNDEAEIKLRTTGKFIKPEILNVLLVAVATSIAIATFFGLQTEKKKQIEVAYIAKLSLVSPVAASDSGVQVSFQNTVINNLTKLSARLSNSGNLPIEERDIEQPVSIGFDPQKVKILKATVTECRPPNLEAEAIIGNHNDLTLKHRLLNPGDYIAFEVLFDGDPAELPLPTLRISGVSKVNLRFPESAPMSYNAAFLQVPRYFEYLIVFLGSMFSILLVLLLGLAASELWKGLFFSEKRLLKGVEKAVNRDELLKALRPQLGEIEGVWLGSVISPQWEWFDNPQLIESFISSEEWKKLTARMSSSGRADADAMLRAIRVHLQEAVAWNFFLAFPQSFGRMARETIKSLSLDPKSTTATQFLDAAKDSVKKKIRSLSFIERCRLTERENIAAFLTMLIFVPASILLILGSRRILLFAPH